MKRRLPWSAEEIENLVSRQHGSLDLLLNLNRNQVATKQIAPLPHAILRRVRKYMEEHLQDKLSMDELARETDYSRAHFLRMFRAATGKTPHQYLTERRIERAKSMLLEAKKISLIDVAARCGFSSQSHLTRVFRKQVGATPTEFKRKPEFKNLVVTIPRTYHQCSSLALHAAALPFLKSHCSVRNIIFIQITSCPLRYF